MTKNEYAQAAALIKHGCMYQENNGIGFFRSEQLSAQGGVEHGFTARTGGVSPAPYDSLHLNFQKPHDMALVREGLRRWGRGACGEDKSRGVGRDERGVDGGRGAQNER